MTLPEVQPEPCRECPWKRASCAGWLGPYTAEEWADLAMSEQPIACHITIGTEDVLDGYEWSQPGLRQCAGASIFRKNVAKRPRDPAIALAPEADRDLVFAARHQFTEHHERIQL